MESLVINTNDGIKQIDKIQFGVLSSEDIIRLSSIEVANRGLYTEERQAVKFGPLDLRLGVCEKGKTCETCGNKIEKCPGHFGYIRLEMPIFHIGYFKYILYILQCICKRCARILLKPDDKEKFAKKLKRGKGSATAREKAFKDMIAQCKKVKKCEHCGEINGTVKNIPGYATSIIHDRYNIKVDPEGKNDLKLKFESAQLFHKDIENGINKMFEDLTPLKVYSLFSRIPYEDIQFFDMNPNFTKPIDLLSKIIIVPPLTIRPTVPIAYNMTNEDDLTIKLSEMLHLNKLIKTNLTEGYNTNMLMEHMSLLQFNHAQYVNAETRGLPLNLLGNKPIRALAQRLKGKHGRFRGNLSGKRVDFSGRTVISPDPNLKIDQVGVPSLIAKTMTFPQRVYESNIKQMKQLVINGPDNYPGANFVESQNGNKIFLQYTSRKKVAEDLKIGDIVERHLMDDDIILFNRQPSLHRQSIMAFRAKVLPWRTLRFNECNCTPFNADFDGDEMNIHLPQTEEAKAEALHLMGVKHNLITPKNAEPLIAATQDFLTTFYLITQRDYFIDRAKLYKFIAYFNDGLEKVDIPPPCILKPKELWSGKQLFSLLLRPNRFSKVIVNIEHRARNFDKKSKKDEIKCPNDGFVIIKNSELLTGNIDKVCIGSGSKNGVVFSLIKDNNQDVAAEVLSRIAKFSSRWIGDYGMSLGIRDVYPKEDLMDKKETLIEECYKDCDKQIELYTNGMIQLKPGMNAEESLESILIKILSDVRETMGTSLISTLPKSNSALIMAVCGSKGSNINLSQMIACLGQQIVSGQRIGDGFYNRTLPHFEKDSKYPAAKGFVKNSFYTGLNATEFFFHTVGGREGLVDTAVKTAETGYMQRRLMKALEDLTAQYDYSVTNSSGEILQFVYGDDGIDPMSVDEGNKVINLNRLMNYVKSLFPKRSQEALMPHEILNKVNTHLSKCPIPKMNQFYLEEVRNFFFNYVEKIEETEKGLNLNSIFGFDIKANHDNPAVKKFRDGIMSITQKQLDEFFNHLWIKYRKALITPGEAVGAVAAQSIGEPGTQMTLKTFHFAGVASMNITLGVPRIKEIINSTKTISTPVIYAKLVKDDDVIAARIVKGRIEKTTLSDVAEYFKEVMTPQGCFIKIKLDAKTINALKLEIKIEDVKTAIIETPKLKLKEKHIVIENSNKLRIEPYDTSKENMYYVFQILKKKLGEVIVCGIPTVNRAVINKKEDESDNSKNSFFLGIEGTGLFRIMTTPGIDHKACYSNNIIEVEKVLGIEAARATIIKEIRTTFDGHSIYVDNRHLQLVADLMTFKGVVLGITRFGISKMKDSTLMLASFEKTTDNLFDSAFHTREDIVKGVSECIIMGKMIPLGTGLSKLIYDPNKHNALIKKDSISKGNDIILSRFKEKNLENINDTLKFNLTDLIK